MRVVRWFRCPVIGTGQFTEEKNDSYRPAIADLPILQEAAEWSAVYYPSHPPYKFCVVRAIIEHDLPIQPQAKGLDNKGMKTFCDAHPHFKNRWLDQPNYPALKYEEKTKEMQALDPVETRYFRSDKHTINTKNNYKLLTTNTVSSQEFTKLHDEPAGGGWVWPFDNPEAATFITEQLGASQLDAADWTFHTWGKINSLLYVTQSAHQPYTVYKVNTAGDRTSLGTTYWTPDFGTSYSEQDIVWSCPETALLATDALQMDSIRFRLATSAGCTRILYFRCGDSTYISRITGFSWTLEVAVPTVTTQAATGLTVGAGTLHGTITATGGENADERGFDWDYDSGAPYAYEETDLGSFGTGAFQEALSGLTQGNTVYFRGKAHNSAGWGYGGELNFVVRKAIERSASAAVGLVGVAKRAFVGERLSAGSIGLVGATDRQFIGERSGSGAIGIVGVSGRGFIGVRSAAPSLSIVAVAAREQVLERVASAAFSLVGVTGRTLAAFRSASATLSLVSATDRVLHAIRSAGAATSIVAVPSRTLHIFRSASGAVSIVGTATRSWIGTRAASAALGVSAVAGRIKGLIRTASASMSVVGTATRSWVGTRSASAEFSLIGTPGRILSAFRSAVASVSLVGTADRMLSAFRSASASLSVVGINERTLRAIRSAVANMAIQGTPSRTLVAFRSAGATISAVATAARSQVLVRTKSASLGITAVSGRMTAAFRDASASMGMAGTAARSWIGSRSAVASITATAVAKRSQILERTQSASMELTAVSGRTLAAVRSAAASMSVTALGYFWRPIIKGIVTLRFAGKTRILDFVDKEKTLFLSAKLRVLDLADKIRKLKFGRKGI